MSAYEQYEARMMQSHVIARYSDLLDHLHDAHVGDRAGHLVAQREAVLMQSHVVDRFAYMAEQRAA